MSKPLIDLGPEVHFINEHARAYHLALQASQADLWLVYCLDLWPSYQVLTSQAFTALVALINGKSYYTGVPIDAVSAAGLVESILDSEDVAQISLKIRSK